MFGFFGYSAPQVRFPHVAALAPAMQAAIVAVEHDGPVVCSTAGLNAAEILLVRKYADPLNMGYTMPLSGDLLVLNAQCVADFVGVPEAARHWNAEQELLFAREEDRLDFETSE